MGSSGPARKYKTGVNVSARCLLCSTRRAPGAKFAAFWHARDIQAAEYWCGGMPHVIACRVLEELGAQAGRDHDAAAELAACCSGLWGGV